MSLGGFSPDNYIGEGSVVYLGMVDIMKYLTLITPLTRSEKLPSNEVRVRKAILSAGTITNNKRRRRSFPFIPIPLDAPCFSWGNSFRG